jgi:alcohol oxidase
MLMPAGKFFTMFHFLEYPFSRGETHIVSPDPYEAPDFDAGFMNDERDMAPMVWGYIKSRKHHSPYPPLHSLNHLR